MLSRFYVRVIGKSIRKSELKAFARACAQQFKLDARKPLSPLIDVDYLECETLGRPVEIGSMLYPRLQ